MKTNNLPELAKKYIQFLSSAFLTLSLIGFTLTNTSCAGVTSAGSPGTGVAPTITTSALPAATVQAAYSAGISATGGTAPYSWSVTSGQLPPGLSLTASSGTIAGTPTQAGTSLFTVQLKDSSSPAKTASQPLSISVSASAAPLQITTASLPSGQAGAAYSVVIAASGGTTPYTWSITAGALPAGLSLGPATGQISGTPTQSGTFPITVQVKDSSSPAQTASQDFNIVIAAAGSPLSITTSSLPSGTQNAAYSATLAATGGKTPYTWSITSGSLPAGVTLAAATGAISGTPTQSGTFPITVQVKDSSSPAQTASQGFNIVIAAAGSPLSITTSSLPSGTQNAAYSATLAATGGKTPYTWSITSGSLPAGVTLAAASGVISGTPTVSGTFPITVQVKDSSSPAQTAAQALSIVIKAAAQLVQITTTSLPNGQQNAAYSATLAASGGTTPYTWSITSGSLPTGVSLTAASGAISGTPTVSGTFPITVQVKDSSSPAQTASASFSLVIAASSSGNCPTGQPCGATAPFCQNYTPPSTSGATAITSLPFKITSSGNYFLNADLSSTGVGIAVLADNVDINLNGHTLTYGTTPNGKGASQIGEYGILMCNTGNIGSEGLDSSYGSNGFCAGGGLSASSVTIENGTLTESPNASSYYDPHNCPGSGVNNGCAHPHDTIASHAVNFSFDHGVTVRHLTINVSTVDAKGIQYQWQQPGAGHDIECNTINDQVLQLNQRSEAYAVIWSGNDGGGTGPDTVQYNTVLGSPQNGIALGVGSTEVSGSMVQNNDINVGYYQFPPFTPFGEMYSNDYALSGCVSAGDVSFNYVHSVSSRGIGCIFGGIQNNAAIHDNYVATTEQTVNAEYSSAGATAGAAWPNPAACEIEGGRGFESKASPFMQIYNNTFVLSQSNCGASALVFVDYPCDIEAGNPSCSASSSFNVHDNTIVMQNTSGSASLASGQPLACYLFEFVEGNFGGYFTTPFTRDNCTTDGEYINSDGFDPGNDLSWVGGTFTLGSHPLASPDGGLLLRWQGQQTPPADETGYVIQDFTFTNGAGLTFEQDGTLLARGATVRWTYTPTVVSSSSGNPVSGALVSVVDAGNLPTTCTTDSQGQCSVVLRQETVTSKAGQALATNSMNPNAVTITAASCTALAYNLTITGTTSDTRTLTCP